MTIWEWRHQITSYAVWRLKSACFQALMTQLHPFYRSARHVSHVSFVYSLQILMEFLYSNYYKGGATQESITAVIKSSGTVLSFHFHFRPL
jgi:hypothetical protein